LKYNYLRFFEMKTNSAHLLNINQDGLYFHIPGAVSPSPYFPLLLGRGKKTQPTVLAVGFH